jgi:hypothetical protein
LVDAFLGFTEASFEKQQAATCCFLKEFFENTENVPAIGRKGFEF